MKNLLLFLLGFILAAALLVGSAHAVDCSGASYVIDNVWCVYTTTPPTMAERCNGGNLDHPINTSTGQPIANKWFRAGEAGYTQPAIATNPLSPTGYYLLWVNAKVYTGCSTLQPCPDSDNDQVCDTCDIDAQSSEIGPDVYVHSQYEHDGKVVAATIGTASGSYKKLKVYDANMPGYAFGAGTIDEETFMQGGGKFTAFAEPEKLYTISCPQVQNAQECGNIECQYNTTDAGDDIENTPGEGEVETPEQKDDLGRYDPSIDEGKRREQCGNNCGGTANIQGFAYSSSGAYLCQCKNGGQASLADDYGSRDDLEEQLTGADPTAGAIENTGTATGSTSGVGASGFGGSLSDSDQDGDIDGYQMGDRTIDFSPLIRGTSVMATKFPFSVGAWAFDLVSEFSAPPSAPSFSVPIWNKNVTFDLSWLDTVAALSRSLFALLLCVWGYIHIKSIWFGA